MPLHHILGPICHISEFPSGFPPPAARSGEAGRDHFSSAGAQTLGLLRQFVHGGGRVPAGIASAIARPGGHVLGEAGDLMSQRVDPVRDVRARARFKSEHVHLPGGPDMGLPERERTFSAAVPPKSGKRAPGAVVVQCPLTQRMLSKSVKITAAADPLPSVCSAI